MKVLKSAVKYILIAGVILGILYILMRFRMLYLSALIPLVYGAYMNIKKELNKTEK